MSLKKSFEVEIINITYEVRRLEAVDKAWVGFVHSRIQGLQIRGWG